VSETDPPDEGPEPTTRPLSGSLPAVEEPSDFARRAAQASPKTSGRVGNLELADRLGLGAMGSVYRAVHTTLRTNFAVKILHPQYSADEEAVERFRLEAVACSRLRHENVVFVTDFGFEEGLGLYIAMEYLEGASLGQMLRWAAAMAEQITATSSPTTP
jgi:serine/threonine-protein kinase